MGIFAETCADKYNFTREEQDAYAIESLRRAREAIEKGYYDWEITAVTVSSRLGDSVVDTDEAPSSANPDRIPTLRPAFKKDGTVTAANASSISDGAAALVLMRASTAEKLGAKPIAKIVAHSQHAHEPEWFTTAPVGAARKLLDKAGWTLDEGELFEINDAFAAVTMPAMKERDVPHDKAE